MISEAIANVIAKEGPMMPDSKTNPSGLIKGDDVRNAMIGPHGSAVASMERTTAIVPQAQSGVNAPKATVAGMDIDDRRTSQSFIFSGSKYTLIAAAIRIPKTRAGKL